MSGPSLQKYVLFSARSEATVIACPSGSRSSRRLPTHNVARARNTLQHTVIAPVKPCASPFLSCAQRQQHSPPVSIAFPPHPGSHRALPLRALPLAN